VRTSKYILPNSQPSIAKGIDMPPTAGKVAAIAGSPALDRHKIVLSAFEQK
jgi:hypothetical protein